MKRKRCFMDISYSGQQGRVELELFNDIVPITAENFRSLCVGYTDETGQKLSYKNTCFHRIINGFIIQGGKVSKDESDCHSIYGDYFDDENLEIPHDQPFLLSMANKGPNTNGSQFFITTSPAPHLDKLHVVFGKLVSGQKIVKAIEAMEVDRSHRPLENVRVLRCGELVYQPTNKDQKKKRSHADDHRDGKNGGGNGEAQPSKKKHAGSNDGEEGEEGEIHPLATRTEISADEIPSVPANKFLQRQVKQDDEYQPSPRRGERFEDQRDRMRSGHTKSGRKIKGRGVFRYRTPTPDTEQDSASRNKRRSMTPLHWRQAQNRVVKLNDLEKRKLERERRHKEYVQEQGGVEEDHSKEEMDQHASPLIHSEIVWNKRVDPPREKRDKERNEKQDRSVRQHRHERQDGSDLQDWSERQDRSERHDGNERQDGREKHGRNEWDYRSEMQDGEEGLDRSERQDRSERPDRSERQDGREKHGRNEWDFRSEMQDGSGQLNRSARQDRSERLERSEREDGREKHGRNEWDYRSEMQDGSGKLNRSARQDRSEKQERNERQSGREKHSRNERGYRSEKHGRNEREYRSEKKRDRNERENRSERHDVSDRSNWNETNERKEKSKKRNKRDMSVSSADSEERRKRRNAERRKRQKVSS